MPDVAVYESTFAVAFNAHPLSIRPAMRIAHDKVIATSGRARRSGVRFSAAALVDWEQALRGLGIDVDADRERAPEDVELLAARYPMGVLIIATVLVDPEVAPHG